jgi:hypothetical protein
MLLNGAEIFKEEENISGILVNPEAVIALLFNHP